jgi:hypothetical protein
MYKTLAETWGAETRFTQSLATDLASLNKITKLVGLPKVTRAENEYPIPGGSIDVVGFTAKGEAIVFEHQDKGGRADQTHVSKTMTYPHQLIIKGFKVLGSILMCETVDEHYVTQFAKERKEYARRKYNGHKNLHIVKSQWTEQDVYDPELFDPKDIIRVEESWPLDQFQTFTNIYAREWRILGEEKRPGTTTLWFRDISRGRHYIHKTKKSIKVGVHFDNPTKEEKWLVEGYYSGRHSQKRSTIEVELDIESTYYDWWLTSERIKQYIRIQNA